VALPEDDVGVLQVGFVDVQQGDGALVQTPSGKLITIDGGENQLFARFLAGRLRDTSPAARRPYRRHGGDPRRRRLLRRAVEDSPVRN
jgi:hypothetical protein